MPLSPESIQNVTSILDGATSKGISGAPGLVFLAVDKSGHTLVEHASGTRGVNSKDPMDMNTTFWIASMTKIVTTIACMQLYEQGKMPLDDAEFVEKWAPEIGKKRVFVDGVTPQDQQGKVTVRMLLAHTAGFGYTFLDPRPMIHGWPVGIDEFAGDEIDYISSPMVNQPGSMWEYGISIDWAGIILERATGLRLNDYFQKYICGPLGLNATTMFPNKEQQQNLAYMHQRDTEGNLTVRDHAYRRPLNVVTKEQQANMFHSGGAGLFSKPREYAKIITTLLNNGTCPTTGSKLLSSSTVNLMFENQIPNQPNFARAGPPPPKPLLANAAPEMYPQEGDPPQGWGLSMFLTLEPGTSGAPKGTGRGANTGWWCGLANSYWWVDREKGVAGVLCSQVLPFGDPKVVPTWWEVERALYQGLGEKK
ncbi:beta-lactamase/transpeptidase-like protein [Lojkania enalia]|uniref:Beta-lactamase/transpeptidase-like protein n=1 Tax=Lojkania enalia TaxID=147567 RepID=A0A9P4ND30_9PLEO|nr:beta-lactamase/transpeptidase-like protein [Didymosphaeria enalia]